MKSLSLIKNDDIIYDIINNYCALTVNKNGMEAVILYYKI